MILKVEKVSCLFKRALRYTQDKRDAHSTENKKTPSRSWTFFNRWINPVYIIKRRRIKRVAPANVAIRLNVVGSGIAVTSPDKATDQFCKAPYYSPIFEQFKENKYKKSKRSEFKSFVFFSVQWPTKPHLLKRDRVVEH